MQVMLENTYFLTSQAIVPTRDFVNVCGLDGICRTHGDKANLVEASEGNFKGGHLIEMKFRMETKWYKIITWVFSLKNGNSFREIQPQNQNHKFSHQSFQLLIKSSAIIFIGYLDDKAYIKYGDSPGNSHK